MVIPDATDRAHDLLCEALVLIDSYDPKVQWTLMQRFLDMLPHMLKPSNPETFVQWLVATEMFTPWMDFLTTQRVALTARIKAELEQEGVEWQRHLRT